MDNYNKVGRSDLFSKYIYIYGMNGENMAKRGNSHIILSKRAIMGGSGTLT